jgi:hypothetical protein
MHIAARPTAGEVRSAVVRHVPRAHPPRGPTGAFPRLRRRDGAPRWEAGPALLDGWQGRVDPLVDFG